MYVCECLCALLLYSTRWQPRSLECATVRGMVFFWCCGAFEKFIEYHKKIHITIESFFFSFARNRNMQVVVSLKKKNCGKGEE